MIIRHYSTKAEYEAACTIQDVNRADMVSYCFEDYVYMVKCRNGATGMVLNRKEFTTLVSAELLSI
jgi:hypothetical protein